MSWDPDISGEIWDLFESVPDRLGLPITRAPSGLDPIHPLTRQFLDADEETRECIRARCKADAMTRAARAPRYAPKAKRPRARMDLAGGVPLDEVRALARVGLSIREIERRTGLGRNRISRALRCARG